MTSGGAAPLRLRKRKDFLAAARGSRRHASAFVLQVGNPAPGASEDAPARFGLTVTKKTVPSAVRRNRIRRRLREALRLGAALSAQPGRDYVFVAREAAIDLPFARLMSDMSAALSAPARERRPKARPSSP
ncbi:MAG TPA: ribonuclease P protein component [Rhodoblastus sp.]|nr:ribonuclease P protein component [Rhodoblastus sp.]